jgi:hypothetical protein
VGDSCLPAMGAVISAAMWCAYLVRKLEWEADCARYRTGCQARRSDLRVKRHVRPGRGIAVRWAGGRAGLFFLCALIGGVARGIGRVESGVVCTTLGSVTGRMTGAVVGGVGITLSSGAGGGAGSLVALLSICAI